MIRTVSIGIRGMTCASCVRTIEKVLGDTEGVQEATVNLASERATVTFDPAAVDVGRLESAIRDAGYEPVRHEIVLKALGMASPHCAGLVEKALIDTRGVLAVDVNFSLETVKIAYDPAAVTLGDLKRAIADAGYKPLEMEGQSAEDREARARRVEIRRQAVYTAMSWILSVPIMLGTFREFLSISSFTPEWLANPYVLWALTTPLMVGPGAQFFVGKRNSVRRF